MGQGKRLCCNCSSGTRDGTSKARGCGWSDRQEEKSAFEATGIEPLISPVFVWTEVANARLFHGPAEIKI